MMPDAYKMLASRQSTYWWHRARRSLASALLEKFGLQKGCRFLDLGCGPGGNLDFLKGFNPNLVVGCDLSPLALAEAKNQKIAVLVRTDINHVLPFLSGTFDVATIFNVLYHSWVNDEEAIFGEILRILAPGGLLLITEPAFPILFREMDSMAMGRKRYRLKEMANFSRSAGFEVLFKSYFTSFGFPLLLGNKILKNLMQKKNTKESSLAADMKPLNPAINEFFFHMANIEASIISHGIPMPIGTTLLMVLRKPTKNIRKTD